MLINFAVAPIAPSDGSLIYFSLIICNALSYTVGIVIMWRQYLHFYSNITKNATYHE